jgi:hypothetical protein
MLEAGFGLRVAEVSAQISNRLAPLGLGEAPDAGCRNHRHQGRSGPRPRHIGGHKVSGIVTGKEGSPHMTILSGSSDEMKMPQRPASARSFRPATTVRRRTPMAQCALPPLISP